MAKKNFKIFTNPTNTTLSGLNIYKDKKGRNIYLNRFNKMGYVISADDEKGYRLYAMRFIIGLVVFVLLSGFILSPVLSALLGVIAYIIMEVKFRTGFLANLTQIPKFVPVAKESPINAAAREDQSRIVLKCFLYLAFGILMAINTYQQAEIGKLEGFMIYASYVIAAIGIVMCGFEVMAFFRKRTMSIESK